MQINRKGMKEEVENLLEFTITDTQFEEALEYASKKQLYIYENEKRTVVLESWYLIKLTEEYVRSPEFSGFMRNVIRHRKRAPIQKRGAPMSIHKKIHSSIKNRVISSHHETNYSKAKKFSSIEYFIIVRNFFQLNFNFERRNNNGKVIYSVSP